MNAAFNEGDGVTRAVSQVEQNRKAGLPRVMVLYVPYKAEDPMEQLAASLVEDITIGLGRLRTLSVVAPFTAKRVVDESTIDSFETLYQQFGVNYVVDSKISKRDGSCFLMMKLIDVLSHDILWSEKQKFDIVLPEQQYRMLSVRIIQSLVETIETSAMDRYSEKKHDPSAYYWYLIGKSEYSDIIELSRLRQARQSFKNAVSDAPNFAPALSGIARTMQLEWLVRARNEKHLLMDGEQIAKRSAAIDPYDEKSLRELGTINMYLGKFDDSLEYFNRSEEINSQHADLLCDFADALVHCGNSEESVKKSQEAISLNPLAPDQYYWVAAGGLFQLGRNAEAVSSIEMMKEPRPAARVMAANLAILGEHEQAAIWRDIWLADHPDFRVGEWIDTMSLRRKEDRERYSDALLKAGFKL